MQKKEVRNLGLGNKGLLIVLSGPAGAGKDAVLGELRKRELGIKQSISMTTRAMRVGEVDGVDYFFTDAQTFEKYIEEDYFLEYVKYNNNYYGTPKRKIQEMLEEGVDVFLKIEVEGAGNVRKTFPEAISIFIVPPSIDVLKERLRGRGTEDEESFNNRIAIAKNELSRAKEYNYVVINDELSACADDVCAIISAEHSRYEKMEAFLNNM
jgi:guanylate kinase